jgi:hypothetical protein
MRQAMIHHLVSAPKHPDPGVFNVRAHGSPRSFWILGLDVSQDLSVLLLDIVGSRPRGGLRQMPPQVDSVPDIVFERSVDHKYRRLSRRYKVISYDNFDSHRRAHD